MLATGDARLTKLLVSTRTFIEEIGRADLRRRPIICIDPDLITHLRFVLGYGTIERLYVIYLDSRRALIKEGVEAEGTVDEVPMFVRDILGRAIRLGAAGIMIAHNHPSGQAYPSRADIDLTRSLCVAGKALGIVIHDHVIVARDQSCSLRSLGLM